MCLCSLCAGTGKTCCQQNDILLTQGDLTRIARHIGTTAFHEYREPLDPFCLGDRADPNWLTYTLRLDGTRRVVRFKGRGDCFFLEGNGCALPQDKRPLICRLHPLLYSEAGVSGVSPDCPAEFLSGGETVLEAVGMDIAEGTRWHAQLYEELRQEAWGAPHPGGRMMLQCPDGYSLAAEAGLPPDRSSLSR